jgi:hypothetical protein
MPRPPHTISHALVLEYVQLSPGHVRTGNTRHIVGGSHVTAFAGLAICTYAGDSGYYLFYCDVSWRAVTDTHHASIAEAKMQAAFEYEKLENSWVDVSRDD